MAIPVVTSTATEDRARMLLAFAALIAACAVLLYVVWLIFASVKATPFDSDGTRCYAKANQMTCIQTAPQHGG